MSLSPHERIVSIINDHADNQGAPDWIRASVCIVILFLVNCLVLALFINNVMPLPSANDRFFKPRFEPIVAIRTPLMPVIGFCGLVVSRYLVRFVRVLVMKPPLQIIEGSLLLPLLVLRPFDWEDSFLRILDGRDEPLDFAKRIKKLAGRPSLIVAGPKARRPNHRIPEVRFKNADWQFYVEELMTLAAGIVIYIKDSPGVWWEFEKVIEVVDRSCLLISLQLVPYHMRKEICARLAARLFRENAGVVAFPIDTQWINFSQGTWQSYKHLPQPVLKDFIGAMSQNAAAK